MQLTEITAPFAPDINAETESSDRRARLSQQMAMVRRRSRLIRTLRVVFPAAIIGLGVLNAGWITVKSIINSMNLYSGNSDEQRMTNPLYFGQSDKGDRYRISGLEAVRKGKDATTVSLKAPSMTFRSDSDRQSHISAANGIFDQNSRLFTLTGHVVLQSGNSDFTLNTEEAVVDVAKSTFHGDKHVVGNGSVGHIEAESFIISDNGNKAVFNGRGDSKVWVTMNNTK